MKATGRVLAALREANAPMRELDLGKRAKVGSWRLYPILDRLLRAGAVTAEWETAQPGSPRRRYYRLR